MPEPAAAQTRKRLPGQDLVSKHYNSLRIQVSVAFLIGANFLTNIVEKEIDPKGNLYADIFEAFGTFYNIAFIIELAVNIYAHWWCEFWRSGWNIFDVVVVTIGLVNMMQLPLPPAFAMLRMMRAFRVFRLFKRVKSLNKIIVAIVHAVPGVANAFLILFIIMSIYSILAVEFFTKMAADCTLPGSPNVIYMTPRGGCVGPEYFGTFSRSIYTFFQVLTGESWSEMVARPAIWYYYHDGLRAVAGSLFFVSYVLVTGFMLINVVVAILLDKMGEAEPPDEEPVGGAAEASKDQDHETVTGWGLTMDTNAEAHHGGNRCPKLNQIEVVQLKVGQLVEDRKEIRAEMDAFRKDLGEMRNKLATVIKLVS